MPINHSVSGSGGAVARAVFSRFPCFKLRLRGAVVAYVVDVGAIWAGRGGSVGSMVLKVRGRPVLKYDDCMTFCSSYVLVDVVGQRSRMNMIFSQRFRLLRHSRYLNTCSCARWWFGLRAVLQPLWRAIQNEAG